MTGVMRSILVVLCVMGACLSSLAAENDLSFLRNLGLAKNMYFLATEDVVDALEGLNTIIDKDVVMWVASMYDPDSGGFYYARSAIGREGFSSDIESTSQAFGLIRSMGLFNSMPDEIRHKLIMFFQNRQDATTGYFYDPQFGSNVSNSKRSRNLSQAVSALRTLGAAPLYSLPYENQHVVGLAAAPEIPREVTVYSLDSVYPGRTRTNQLDGFTRSITSRTAPIHTFSNEIKYTSNFNVSETPLQQVSTSTDASKLPDYLTSENALRGWLESLSWGSNPYSAGHNVSSARSEITQVGLLDTVYEFIEEIQNKETGLWGSGLTYNELSAAMKLSGYYSGSRPYPNASNMVRSVMHILEHDTPRQIFFIYNPPSLIKSALINGSVRYDPEIDALLQELIPRMIEAAKINLLKFKQPDKSFSYYERGSSPTSQGARVSLGLPEADMNATAGANGTVNFLYEIIGVPRPNLLSGYAEKFWDAVVGMEPHEPIIIPVGLCDDFETDDEQAQLWVSSTGTSIGDFKFIADPHDSENQVMQIVKTDTSRGYSVSRSFESRDGSQATSISFKFMVSEFDRSPAFNLLFGERSGGSHTALNFVIAKQNGEYFFSHRTSGRGTGTRLADIAPNEWYTVDIKYEPAGIENTKLTVYVDGEFVRELNEYYNTGDETKDPIQHIKYLEFYGYINAAATLYVDDVQIQAK